MKRANEFEARRNNFLALLKQIDDALADYVDALKKQSSEELLSGSPEVAKAYLEEIILLESNTNDLLQLMEKIVDHIEKTGNVEKHKKPAPRIRKINIKQQVAKTDLTKQLQEEIRRLNSELEDTKYNQPASREVSNYEEEEQVEDTLEDEYELEEQNLEVEEEPLELEETQVELTRPKPKKIRKKIDSKIPILKSLIYLGGIANEDEINKYMQQYNNRNGDADISIDELRSNLDTMCEKEMISVDPLDDNIEILQNGIDYLAKYEI
jgi:hypothetical protein